jgi:hypothetical protein
MNSSALTFVALFTISLTLVGCGEDPNHWPPEAELDAFAAPDDASGETGEGQDDEGSGDGGEFGPAEEGGYESGCEEGAASDSGGNFDQGDDGETTGADPLPEAGFCMSGAVSIGACLTGDPMMLGCTPAYISTCEQMSLAFEAASVPEVQETGYDCDNLNQAIIDCSDQWFTNCVNGGGYLDCHNWDENDNCIEASCEDEPIPG